MHSKGIQNHEVVRKKVKSGVINSGYEYEKLVPAYIALHLLIDPEVKSFIFELNPSSYKKFDDLIIEVTKSDDTQENFAFQFRHKELGRNDLNAINEFDRTDSRNKAKGFNISEYYKAYNAEDKAIQDKYNFILFTNAKFKNIDKVSTYKIMKFPEPFKTKFFNSAGILQFSEISSTKNSFYEKFFLLSEQKTVSQIREEIETMFVEKFNSSVQNATCFISFFQQVHDGDYENTTVTRDSVLIHLIDLLLSNHIIKLDFKQEEDLKIKLIEEVLKKFDLTVLSTVDTNFLQSYWKYPLLYSETILITNLAKEWKFMQKNRKLTDDIKLQVLCYIKEKPLFIRFNEENKKIISHVLFLMETVEKRKIKLVLVGNVDQKLSKWRIFQNLQDLSEDQDLYLKFCENFKISLQGRKPESIKLLREDMNLDLSEFLTPNEIFKSLESDPTIGKQLVKLPELFITRKLHNESSKTEFICDISKIEEYIQNRTEIDIFNKRCNVLTGDPGSGKTTIFQYLAKICPSEYWVAFFSTEMSLKRQSNIDELLESCLLSNQASKSLAKFLLKERKVIFFFETVNNFSEISDVIRHIVKDNYKIWISCNTCMRKKLEGILDDCYLYSIDKISRDAQEKYLRETLKKRFDNESVNKRIGNILKNNCIKRMNIFQDPLNLKTLAEYMEDLEGNFSINRMFEKLTDTIFRHTLKKDDYKVPNIMIDTIKNYHFDHYQTLALEVCLETEFFLKLKINVDENFLCYIRKTGDFLGMVRINEDDKLSFVHLEFAEYFTAMWMYKNFDKIPNETRNFVLQSKYSGVREFFDDRIAEKCPFQLKIPNKDLSKLEITCESTKASFPLLTFEDFNINKNPKIQIKVNDEDLFLLTYCCIIKRCTKLLQILIKQQTLKKVKEQYLEKFIHLIIENDLENLGICLVENGINLPVDFNGQTVLHKAALQGHSDLIKLLLKQNLDIEKRDNFGNTALHFAIKTGDFNSIKVLCEHGANIAAANHTGETPLHVAAYCGNIENVSYIIQKIDDVNIQDKKLKTPLHVAVEMNNYEIVKCLVGNGADINIVDEDNKTAFDRGFSPLHNRIAQYLLSQKFLSVVSKIDSPEKLEHFMKIIEAAEEKTCRSDIQSKKNRTDVANLQEYRK